MSEFNTGQALFSDQENKPRTVKIPISFTTVQVTREFLLQFGLRMVRLVINNRDAAAQLTFRVEPSGTLEIIPPSTRGELTDEKHSFLEINPNAVTGIGEAFAFCAPTIELERKKLLGS